MKPCSDGPVQTESTLEVFPVDMSTLNRLQFGFGSETRTSRCTFRLQICLKTSAASRRDSASAMLLPCLLNCAAHSKTTWRRWRDLIDKKLISASQQWTENWVQYWLCLSLCLVSTTSSFLHPPHVAPVCARRLRVIRVWETTTGCYLFPKHLPTAQFDQYKPVCCSVGHRSATQSWCVKQKPLCLSLPMSWHPCDRLASHSPECVMSQGQPGGRLADRELIREPQINREFLD